MIKKAFIVLIVFILCIILGLYLRNIKSKDEIEEPVEQSDLTFDFQNRLAFERKEMKKPEQMTEIIEKKKESKPEQTVKTVSEKNEPIIQNKADDGKNYFIQIASFDNEGSARVLVDKVKNDFPETSIIPAEISSVMWYRVRIGPIDTNKRNIYENVLKTKYRLTPWVINE